MYPSLDIQTLIMLAILIVENSLWGTFFQFMGGAISWRSRLKECTTLSTAEAEYVAASKACKEVV